VLNSFQSSIVNRQSSILPYTLPRQIIDGVLNLFFPEDCLSCGASVARRQDRGVCDLCWEKALSLRIVPPWCPCCGLPFQQRLVDDYHLCGPCAIHLPSFSGARAFGYYMSELRQMIHSLKFRGRRDLSSLFAPLLASVFHEAWTREEVDLIVPVPLHPKRQRERTFNQAAVLARDLARLLALPYREHALSRVRYTPPQVGLSDAERLLNIRQAFVGRQELNAGKRILLIDDVMTTGATVAGASQALLQAGARRVSVLTLARAVPGMDL
jgi:competence protein ComFC